MPRKNKIIATKPKPIELANKTCRNKRRFSNEKSADKAAEFQNLADFKNNIETYKCPTCNGWHLTSK